MHEPNLVEIHWKSIEVIRKSGNENTDGHKTDGLSDRETDTWTANVISYYPATTDGLSDRETDTWTANVISYYPRHYRVADYKKRLRYLDTL